MADFFFYGTWEDSWMYLETLVHLERFTFAIDMWYAEPAPFQFETMTDEVENIVRKRRRLYLWSSEYSRFPFVFSAPTSNGLMMIDPTVSGPVLDLSLPDCFDVEGRLSIGLGSLGYQPQYENPETGELYKPPEALKQAYKEIRALLQKGMVKRFARSRSITEFGIKPAVESLWVGANAVTLLETGTADILVGCEWVWKEGTELRKTRDEAEALPYED
jgi:hypothetical protein